MKSALMVVVGGHTRSHGSSVVLGSTAENLVRCTSVPILIARGFGEGAPERILVAVDDSSDAAAALAGFAAGEAEVEVVAGEPAQEILAAEQRGHMDLIVIGTHRGGAIARALLGSVASSVLRGASCPVLVVHAKA